MARIYEFQVELEKQERIEYLQLDEMKLEETIQNIELLIRCKNNKNYESTEEVTVRAEIKKFQKLLDEKRELFQRYNELSRCYHSRPSDKV